MTKDALLQPTAAPEPLIWSRSFAWGMLSVHDPAADFVPPPNAGKKVAASASVLTIPVLHQQDRATPDGWPDDLPLPWARVDVYVSFVPSPPGSEVQFECQLACPSGHLLVGDADEQRDISITPGTARVQVGLVPDLFADVVILRVLPQRSQ